MKLDPLFKRYDFLDLQMNGFQKQQCHRPTTTQFGFDPKLRPDENAFYSAYWDALQLNPTGVERLPGNESVEKMMTKTQMQQLLENECDEEAGEEEQDCFKDEESKEAEFVTLTDEEEEEEEYDSEYNPDK